MKVEDAVQTSGPAHCEGLVIKPQLNIAFGSAMQEGQRRAVLPLYSEQKQPG